MKKLLSTIILVSVLLLTGCSNIVDNTGSTGTADVSSDMNSITYYYYTDKNGDDLSLDISCLEGLNATIIDITEFNAGYCLLYHSENDEGAVIYDKHGNYIDKNEFYYPFWPYSYAKRKLDADNMENIRTFCIGENQDLLYIHLPPYNHGTDAVYDISNDILYTAMWPNTIKDDTNGCTYYMFRLIPQDQYQADWINLAVKESESSCEYISFSYPIADGIHPGSTIKLGNNRDELIFSVPRIGLEVLVNFENHTVTDIINIDARYSDSETSFSDYGILATSPNGRYSVFYFDVAIPGSRTIKQMALKDNSTGKTKYLGELYSQTFSYIDAGVGFISDDEIYHYDKDYKIYSTDMNQKGYIFRLSDKFPLKYYRDENGDIIIHHVFDFISLDNKGFAVLYCNYKYEHDVSVATDHNYLISILDSEGNIIRTTDTGVALYHKNDGYTLSYDKNTLYINTAYSDNIIKGEFNMERGVFCSSSVTENEP